MQIIQENLGTTESITNIYVAIIASYSVFFQKRTVFKGFWEAINFSKMQRPRFPQQIQSQSKSNQLNKG